jgi:hypothetical protein
MRSRPPKRCSSNTARVESRLLQAINKIDTAPMKSAKLTLSSSPTAFLKANQPTSVVPTAMTGPIQWDPRAGIDGGPGFSRRQSYRDPIKVRATLRGRSAHCCREGFDSTSVFAGALVQAGGEWRENHNQEKRPQHRVQLAVLQRPCGGFGRCGRNVAEQLTHGVSER